jgi:hypothetical protein
MSKYVCIGLRNGAVGTESPGSGRIVGYPYWASFPVIPSTNKTTRGNIPHFPSGSTPIAGDDFRGQPFHSVSTNIIWHGGISSPQKWLEP